MTTATSKKQDTRPKKNGPRYVNRTCPMTIEMIQRLRALADRETERLGFPVPVVSFMRRFIQAGLDNAERTTQQ